MGILAALAIQLLIATPAVDAHPYPYGSRGFDSFVAASFLACSAGRPSQFYRWFEKAFEKQAHSRLHPWLVEKRRFLIRSGNSPKAEREVAAELHGIVKKAIPRFSLDRGFEFVNAMRTGERQCLLQSVLIAGLLQALGVDAGAAMVWKSERGEESNLGHVVCIASPRGGRQFLIDASDSEPFARHQGLLLAKGFGKYAFVRPTYDAEGGIAIFSPVQRSVLNWAKMRPLDVRYLRSQFDFYRAERAPGGLLAEHPTSQGLGTSERFMARAVRDCPQNPLAVYSLGRVYRLQTNDRGALMEFERAQKVYAACGMVPPGPTEALAAARAKVR